MFFASIAIAVMIALGGGAAVLANDAQPGDTLYGYKTHVNENVRAGVEATADAFTEVRTSVEETLDFDANADVHTEAEVRGENNTNVVHEGKDASSSTNADGSLKADVGANVQVGL